MDLLVIYLTVLAIGALHGLDPGHGWPLAFFYSTRRERPLLSGLITSSILAGCHLLSSFIVVAAYLLITAYIPIPAQYLNYGAAIILVVLAIIFWREKIEDEMETQHEHFHGNKEFLEHEHEHQHLNGEVHTHVHSHQKSAVLTLGGIASYGLVLGFAHEEQFALLAFIASGANPWVLITIYSLAVAGSLIAITLLCIRLYNIFIVKLRKYEKYMPKISAIVLLILVVWLLVG
jgi:ABC-type nickel/cobalt efflux system permease component RcnA